MTHICQRRDTAANWAFYNPVLYLGELGWEVDTRKAKLGDGVSDWSTLSYIVESGVTSVNGETGDVVITKADIGLGNADNTSDEDKPVSDATAAAIAAAVSNVLLAAHPVGSIYMSETDTDPATLFGGTWARHGQGQVLVGVNESDSDFNTPGKTGGEKAHTLTAAEMPSHSHSMAHTHTINHGHSASAGANGEHSHNLRYTANTASNYMIPRGQGGSNVNGESNNAVNPNGNHTHSISVANYNGSSGGSSAANTGATGSGDAHNNLQPFTTVYMWKRTA